jgi:hypothetical protein
MRENYSNNSRASRLCISGTYGKSQTSPLKMGVSGLKLGQFNYSRDGCRDSGGDMICTRGVGLMNGTITVS